MARVMNDTQVLKITLDPHGIVWYLDGDGLPHSSSQTARDFLGSPYLREADTIRSVGTIQNAQLLRHLYEKKLRKEFDSLQVCSPLCCESLEDRKDPALMLFKMRTYSLPPSLGGWHEFGLEDLPSYLLAAHYFEQDEPSAFTKQAMKVHKLWAKLSFIEGLDVDMVSRLVGLLVDPRWYVDASEPNRGARFEQYLGINPKNAVLALEPDCDWKVNRCKLVLACWKGTEVKPKEPKPDPHNFLWRVWHDKGGGYKGDLAASKVFADFTRQLWLQAVFTGPRPERLFIPEYFFLQQDEVNAYKSHIAQLK